jgi:cleavage and polyadenylation specificity factor subunit 1
MQCYTELTPPTVVTHSISLPFLSSKATNLVVAKTSVLQIFHLTQVSTEIEGAAKDGEDNSPLDNAAETLDGFNADMDLHRLEHTARLVLLSEHALAGTVTSIRRVKILSSKSGGEALLIAFADAKLSLVEWDPEKSTLSTISIHYYEGEGLQACPWVPDLSLCHNFLTVDPTSRCAALKFGHRHLAILPFRQIAGDLGEADFDEGFDDPAERPVERKATNGDIMASDQKPYTSSFVLSLTTLDPSLTHPIHLAFLHEYREPTFGVLYSSRALGSAMLQERKDILNYTVFTLDIEQRASTTILSIAELPNDLHEVLPLPLPVGGALLVGSNELVHVDEAGKTNGIAVNEFSKQVSAFPMVDQAELGLRLEGCRIEQLGESGDMLIILTNGQLAVITFTMEGRSVSGLRVHKVSPERGGSVLPTGASCACSFGKGKIFLGSEDSDAVVLGWSRKTPQLARKRSHADMLSDEADLSFDEVDLDDDDDDLYGADESSTKQQTRASVSGPTNPADFVFRVHDRLPNYAPTGDITIGSTQASLSSSKEDASSDPMAERELIYPSGRKAAGGLAVLRREIDPAVQFRKRLPTTKAIWGVRPIVGLAAGAEFDEYLVASLSNNEGSAESALYKITATGLEPTQKDDFDPEAGATIEVGTVASSSRIVQVLSDEVKCYDAGKQQYVYFLPIYSTAYQNLGGISRMASMPQARSVISRGMLHGSNACAYRIGMGLMCNSTTCVSFWLLRIHWLWLYVTSLTAGPQIAQYYSICPFQHPYLLARVF